MKRMYSVLAGAALIALVGAASLRADEARQPLRELPPLLRAVSDEPGALSVPEGQSLSRRIADIEQATGVKMVALVVVTVAPESIDAYVQRLINHWKRQSRALDNGRFVFIVIARNDRELRIVPGPELAWVLEPLSGKAVVETVPSFLRSDRYYEALLTIVNGIEQLIIDRKRKVRLDKAHSKPAYDPSKGKDQAWRASTV